ncbi:hypothetical protein C4544_00315 [candidate division WS5 bacterium]|uniref:Carbonic anhydrase n=1 Tax=candidate division WS5 bacterium TaxID=2093353 RepID=A0A419DGS7_9BACT|nr:MAG: hypothetical protein C4544_00315 [candidate division WS5 bacterium]
MESQEKVSIVLSCIDYRFWPDALPMLEKEFGEFDLIELAGGSKNLTTPLHEADRKAVLDSIKTAVELHDAKEIILTNHTDCGAYGGSKKFGSFQEEIDFHKSELKKAEEFIKKSFPKLSTKLVIISCDKDNRVNLLLV